MAAYAAVVSLMTTVDHIKNHPLLSFSLDKKQIQSLHEILSFLLDFIESYNCGRGSKEDEALESRIASAAHAAEDVIESHVVDQIHDGASPISLLDLEAIITDINSVKETVMEFQETEEFRDVKLSSYSAPLTSSNEKNVMVGFDDELTQIMDRLTGHQLDLQIVPIVGMGGIGKTTLASNVYENSLIVYHFDIRAWATISQEYNVNNILSEISKSLKEFDCDEDQLGLKLYQTLWGRRYLIVLDDMWSIEVWDKIKCFFPDNNCGSRIVVTTRLSKVATHLSSSSFKMNFLDEDKSWKLFYKKTFPEECCPPELEEIGKKIVRDCKGLPLSISVIGGLLRKSRRQEYWESIARDTNSMLMSEKDEHCLNILSLSYNHLPAHLKPCFLYIGIFQNYRVRATVLINLFVAEGFLRPNNHQSLEEIASDYLNDLVDRNLILVRSRRLNGGIKYLRMHDLVTEVCLRIAEKEKIFYKMRVTDNPPDMSRERCIALFKKNWPHVFDVFPTTSRVRTFISNGVRLPFNCWLLRVAGNIYIDSVENIHQLVNLRYLSCKLPGVSLCKLLSSISLLWNLQTLIINGRVDAPVEIWHMRQLRHLYCKEVFLPDPPPSDNVDKLYDHLLPDLRTLLQLVDFNFTEEVCKRIPNITKLRIIYDDFSMGCQQKNYYYLNNLVNLLKLECLGCCFRQPPKSDDLLQSLLLPWSLRKLYLWNSRLHWEDLISFGFSLPHLEVLKLYWNSAVGPEWNCVEGAFPSLRFLKICDANLMKWTAEDSDFPKLEKLHLQNLKNLENIPSGVGDIQTLQYLHLYECSESSTNSATEILEEQRDLGNDYLQVQVRRKRELKEIESFTGRNFQRKTSEPVSPHATD